MTNQLRKRLRGGDSLDWRPQALLLAALAIMLLPWLGDILFNSKGEPREAIVAVSILDSGNWVLPTSFGTDIPYKPPFLAWLIAAIAAVFNGGVVNEYICRLPSALALIGLCWATYRWAAHSRGARFGLLTAMLLATSAEVFRAGIACRVDMLLAACSVVPVFILDRARTHPAAWRYAAATLLLSCATLTKGPVGSLLPCLVLGIYFLLDGERFGSVLWRLSAVCVASFIIPALWYVAAWRQGGDAFLDLAYEENILRLVGKMPYESHVNPWWYNFLTLAAGLLPWTLLLAAVPLCLRRHAYMAMRTRSGRKRLSHAGLLAVVGAAVVVLFYTIPASKRSVYLLPAYPFIAYALAAVFMRLRMRWPAAAMAWLLSCLAIAAPIAVLIYAAANDGAISHLGYAALMPPMVAGAWWILRRSRPVASSVVCAATLYLAYLGAAGPMALNPRSDEPLARRIASERPTGTIYQLAADKAMRAFTINYYLHDRVCPVGAPPADAPSGAYMLIPSGADTTGLAAAGWSRPDTLTARSCDHRRPMMITVKR
ncbi:MAG: glycosyltransferase family 39 protein [Muribaculaceae bacterium]|nr:glycosyltransferase family 39 protein [Muribaculaceae bacterium]